MAQATSFDHLLTQCRDLVRERLTAALSDMLDEAGNALLAMLSEARDADAQKLYMDAREKVLSQREAIKTQFEARYLREFQLRSNRVKKIGDSFSDVDLSSTELQLVGEEDLHETLKFNALAARLRQFCEEELIALDQRVGVLLGDASLQPEDDPFTPQAICDAYKHTCRQIDSDINVRMILLKLFDDHVVDDIRAVYKAVNALLVQNSILPKIRIGSGRQTAKGPQEARPGQASAQPADKAAEGEQDLFSVLQKLLTAPRGGAVPMGVAGAPATGGSVAGAGANAGPALQGADLLRSLTRIQFGDPGAVATAGLPLTTDVVQAGTTNVLRELKGSSLGSGMNHMDSMTLDIMAMLFDQLFDEPRIPIGVKGLIGRLQIPMLKVAIADKTFFSRKTHPARQMLDTLGEISTRLPADFDVSNPMYARLEAILHEVIDKFEDNVEIFNGVRERLQTLVAEEDKRIEQETQSSAKKVEQKENLAVAKAVAQAEIKVRIRGARVPVPVLKFLIEEWIKLLIVVEVKHGDSSEEWKNALKTIELLVWSVEPKETEEDRRKLVAMLPDLLRRLIAGAQLAGIEEDVRTRFFADLRKLHTDSVGKAAEVDATADAEGVAPLEPQPEPTPESSAPEEMAPLDFGSPDAERTEAKVPSETPQEVLSPAPAQASPLLPELPEMGSTPPGPLIPDLPGFPPSSKPEAPLPPELPDMLLPPARESPPAAESQQAAPAEESPLVPELPDLAFTPREAASRPPAPQTPAESSPLLPELPDLSFTPREAAPQPSQASAPASGQAPKPTAPPEAPAPRPAASQTPPPPPRTAQPHPAPPRAPAPPQATPAPPRAPGAPRSAQQGTPAARAPQQPAAAPRAPAQPAQGAARGTPAPAARPAAAAQGRQPAPPAAGAPNFTAAITVKNPFGEGKVEVDDLDFTTKPAAAPARGKPEADPDLPANFVVGTWVDIRDKDSHRPAKLTFVSPLKTRYLFVNRQGKNTLECSRAELVRRLRLGEITIAKETPDAPLFDRLMGDLVNKLAGPTGKS